MTPLVEKFRNAYYKKHKADFFDKDVMKSNGDTLTNFGVEITDIQTIEGEKECYRVFRKKPNRLGLTKCKYFDLKTLQPLQLSAVCAIKPKRRSRS